MAKECTNRSKKNQYNLPPFLTMGELAKAAGCERHQAEHFINSRNIQEVTRIGQHRVFSETTLQQLKAHIENLKNRRRRNAG